jgi:hypothetical protein
VASNRSVPSDVRDTRGWRLVTFAAGKAVFFTLAFGTPAISRPVEATCRVFGIADAEHTSFQAGIASHVQWLRRMRRASASRGSYWNRTQREALRMRRSKKRS